MAAIGIEEPISTTSRSYDEDQTGNTLDVKQSNTKVHRSKSDPSALESLKLVLPHSRKRRRDRHILDKNTDAYELLTDLFKPDVPLPSISKSNPRNEQSQPVKALYTLDLTPLRRKLPMPPTSQSSPSFSIIDTPVYTTIRRSQSDSGKELRTCLKGDGLARRILYKNNKINNDALFDMCRTYGRTSPEVTNACEHIRMQILACSMSFKDVEPTYKPAEPDSVVFIVFCEPDLDRTVELPLFVSGFDVVFRTIGEFSEEDKGLSTESQLFSKTDQSDQKKINDILKKMSSHFMNKHSNLNIISASPVKSKAYALKKQRLQRKPCIVFYVRLKGYIPLKEEEFPRQAGSYETDVREGAFTLYNDPEPFAQRLKIGCSMGEETNSGHFGGTGGTLGAFVDLGHGKVGCISSAHVLLSETQLHSCKDKNKIDNIHDADTIYQPAPSLVAIPGNKPFGRVASVVYRTGGDGDTGVEAALISISDHTRYPNDGRFPKLAEDFTVDNELNYTSGHILRALPDDISQQTFYKYGAKTKLTRGAFNLHASAVRTNGKLDVWGNCELHNQIEVVSLGEKPFAKPGDSGALVLLSRNDDLHAIGIVTGGTLDFTKFYITPIWEVLKALGLPLQLKNFHLQIPMETDHDRNEYASLSSEINAMKIDIEAVKSNFDKEIKTLNQTVETKVGNVETKVDRLGSEMKANFKAVIEAITNK